MNQQPPRMNPPQYSAQHHQMNLPGPSNRSPQPTQPVHPGAAHPQIAVNPQQIHPQPQQQFPQPEFITPFALPSVLPNGSKVVWAKIRREAPVFVAGQGMVKRVVDIPIPIIQPNDTQQQHQAQQQMNRQQIQMPHGVQQQATQQMAPAQNALAAHQMRPAQPAAPQASHTNASPATIADALRQVLNSTPTTQQQPQQWQQMGTNGGTLNMLNTNTMGNEGKRSRRRKKQTPMRGTQRVEYNEDSSSEGTAAKRPNLEEPNSFLLNSLHSTKSPGSKENNTRTPTHISV